MCPATAVTTNLTLESTGCVTALQIKVRNILIEPLDHLKTKGNLTYISEAIMKPCKGGNFPPCSFPD